MQVAAANPGYVDEASVPAEMCIRDRYTAKVAKDLGGDIKIVKFTRFQKGEGLEKRADAVSYTHLDVYKRQVDAREADRQLAHGLCGIHMEVAVGAGLQHFRDLGHRLHHAQLTVYGLSLIHI